MHLSSGETPQIFDLFKNDLVSPCNAVHLKRSKGHQKKSFIAAKTAKDFCRLGLSILTDAEDVLLRLSGPYILYSSKVTKWRLACSRGCAQVRGNKKARLHIPATISYQMVADRAI